MPMAQWRLARYLLIYRCGGSAGIACCDYQIISSPVFPFHSIGERLWNTRSSKGIYALVGVLSIMNISKTDYVTDGTGFFRGIWVKLYVL
jgi:hypothetical protein